MPHIQYSVGSAFAQALRMASDLMRDDNPICLRPVDYVNAAQHCAAAAHDDLLDDPAGARELLIHSASRLLAAAEMLERPAVTGPSAEIIPFPGAGRRSVLRAV